MDKKLGVDMAVLQTKMENIEKEQTKNYVENRQDHEEIKKIINDFINSADTKYASNHIEAIVKYQGEEIDSIKNKIYYFMGGVAVIVTIVQVLIAIYL